ncbi:MAG: 23S rRNA (guanosine(2251)-2'-O)-methyltransferase RlmB, partial [Myxococcota bacterium]
PPGEHLAGVPPVREALRAGRRREKEVWLLTPGRGADRRAQIASLARDAGVPVTTASRDRLARLAGTEDHQGIVAAVEGFPYEDAGSLLARIRACTRAPLILALDSVQDPRNLGSMIRCANTAGAQGVVIPKDRSAGITAVAARASAGAVEHTPVARVTNLVRTLGALRDAGLWIVGAAEDGEKTMDRFDASAPLVLVIGGEGKGLRPLVRKSCDLRVSIPMAGEIASLNAATAAAVLLHEAGRQRRSAGG